MSEDYNDPARETARYLHFEYEDPSIPDVQFKSVTDAINWVAGRNWGPEGWFKPTGMIEEKIRVFDYEGNFMGELIRVREDIGLIRDGQHRIQLFIWRRP
jgi:hypothetical protein